MHEIDRSLGGVCVAASSNNSERLHARRTACVRVDMPAELTSSLSIGQPMCCSPLPRLSAQRAPARGPFRSRIVTSAEPDFLDRAWRVTSGGRFVIRIRRSLPSGRRPPRFGPRPQPRIPAASTPFFPTMPHHMVRRELLRSGLQANRAQYLITRERLRRSCIAPGSSSDHGE